MVVFWVGLCFAVWFLCFDYGFVVYTCFVNWFDVLPVFGVLCWVMGCV